MTNIVKLNYADFTGAHHGKRSATRSELPAMDRVPYNNGQPVVVMPDGNEIKLYPAGTGHKWNKEKTRKVVTFYDFITWPRDDFETIRLRLLNR